MCLLNVPFEKVDDAGVHLARHVEPRRGRRASMKRVLVEGQLDGDTHVSQSTGKHEAFVLHAVPFEHNHVGCGHCDQLPVVGQQRRNVRAEHLAPRRRRSHRPLVALFCSCFILVVFSTELELVAHKAIDVEARGQIVETGYPDRLVRVVAHNASHLVLSHIGESDVPRGEVRVHVGYEGELWVVEAVRGQREVGHLQPRIDEHLQLGATSVVVVLRQALVDHDDRVAARRVAGENHARHVGAQSPLISVRVVEKVLCHRVAVVHSCRIRMLRCEAITRLY